MSITTSCNQVLGGGGLGSSVPQEYWELASQYRDELIHQAYSILGSMEDAEDVVQETFCEAFKDRSKIHPESIGASLRLINKTNALDRLRVRSRARQRDNLTHRSPTQSFTTGGFRGIELRESVEKALLTLPENMRAALKLRYYEQLSYKQIAERMGLAIGAVGPLLSEAGMRLYPQLAAFGGGRDGAAEAETQRDPASADSSKPEESSKSSRRFTGKKPS